MILFIFVVYIIYLWELLLGLKYAGTKSEEARELLYNYALYFLNEVKSYVLLFSFHAIFSMLKLWNVYLV